MNERDVFIAALQRGSRARWQAYLDEACGKDRALRRRVEALLEAHDRAGNFLQEPLLGSVVAAAFLEHPTGSQPGQDAAPETKDRTTESRPPALEFLAPPQRPDEMGRLGHYRVLRLLGQGGMGLVFLADDTRLQRSVALKVMRPELAANPDSRQRFLREARAAAGVRSDRVVTIYHVDQEGDLPYLVMEVLHGRSLADALEKEGRLPLGLGLQVARQTAEGLAAAHASGVIHRDVKPGNVWLEEPSGRVKLLDFGLARPCTDVVITQPHVIIGTPAYMSPEQAAGKPLDARCDLFSLGAVLYQVLTGRHPFAGKTLVDVLAKVLRETPPQAASLVPGLPAGVADLLDRLLSKDPAGRPASAAEVAHVLRALEQEAAEIAPAAGKQPAPIGAETTILLRPVVSPGRRKRVLAVGLGLACLVLGLLAAVFLGAFRGRPDGQASADAPGLPPIVPPQPPPPVQPFALLGHGSQVQALAFTADSKTLVSGEYREGMVKFWDVDRRETTFEMPATPGGLLECLALDPQRRWLAVGPMSPAGQVHPGIRLFRYGEAGEAGCLKGHTDRVLQLVFLEDGRTLLSAGYDGSIRRWDVVKQQQGEPLRVRGPRIDCLRVWEDGRGGLRLGIAGSRFAGLEDAVLERFPYGNGMVALSPDGTRLACSKQERMARARDSFVALWKLPEKISLGELPEAPIPRGLAFTPDGKHVVVASGNYTSIYDSASGQQAARVGCLENAVALAVSPDGRWLAVGMLTGEIRVWHLPSLLAPPG